MLWKPIGQRNCKDYGSIGFSHALIQDWVVSMGLIPSLHLSVLSSAILNHFLAQSAHLSAAPSS